MAQDKEKKEQDDKKFFRNEPDSTNGTNEDKKKRVTIPLPDLDFAIHKESPLSSPQAPPEPKPKKERPLPEPIQEKKEEAYEEFPAEKHEVIKRGPSLKILILLFILIAFLFASIAINIFLANNLTSLKETMSADAKIVENIAFEKEKMAEQRKYFEKDIERSKNELTSASNKYKSLEKKKEEVERDLIESKRAYLGLESQIRGYADEIKKLSTTRIGFFDIYKNEKENAKRLDLKVKTLEQEKNTLVSQLDSVDGTLKEQEAFYIYDMAFLSVEANMFDAAIHYFKRYMELTKEDPDIYYNLAVIYEQVKKDRTRAMEYYQKYMDLKPDAQDLYEIAMRIESLRRIGTEKKSLKNFKIDLDTFKY